MEFALIFYLFLAVVTISSGRILPKNKFCADPECKTPISTGYTLISYASDHHQILSFKAREQVVIYSKLTEENLSLLDVMIGGKRGLVPKGLIREVKVLKKDVNHLVLIKDESRQQPINKSNVDETGTESANKNKTEDPINKSYVDETVTESANINKIGDGKDSEMVVELNATVDTQYMNEGEHLSGNNTLYNNETKMSVASVIPDENNNQTQHLSSATSSENVQGIDIETHSTQYSTVAHFQRKLSAVDEVGDSGEQIRMESQEASDNAGSIDNSDVLFSDSQEQKDDEEEEGKDYADNDGDDDDDDDNDVGEDEDESLHEEQELDEYEFRNETDVDEPENSTDTENEETSNKGVSDKDQEAVETEIRSEDITDNLNLKSSDDNSVNETIQQLAQHNLNSSDVDLNYTKNSVPNIETQSISLKNTEVTPEQEKVQQPLSDVRDSVAVVNSPKEETKFNYLTPHITPTPKATVDEVSSSMNQQQGEAVESRELHTQAAPEIVDSEVDDKKPVGSETKPGQLLSEEPEFKETKNEESAAVENTMVSDSSKGESQLDHNSSEMTGSTKTLTESDQIYPNILSGNVPLQSEKDDDLEANNITSEELKSEPESIEEESSETSIYFRDNKSSPQKESFSLEDDVSLPLTTEKSPTDSLIEEIMATSDNLITTESTISLESQPHYVAPDEVAKISQNIEENSELTETSANDETVSHEKSTDENASSDNVDNGGFFAGISESLISTLKGIQLGFGSAPEQQEELQVSTHNQLTESGDTMQDSSSWNSDHTMQETASHVATDPDQTGHKVDVEVLSGNDLHSLPQKSSVCESEISCSGQFGLIPSEPQQQESSMSEDHGKVTKGIDVTEQLYGALSENALYMVITGIVTACVLAFTILVSHFLQKPRFIALTSNIFKLEKELLCLKTDNSTLREELQKKTEEINFIQISSVDSDKTVMQLKLELESSQAARTELEEQVASLEKELEAATEAGLELNRMLSDFLSTQHGSETLVKSVEHLQKQLDAQQLTIVEMNNNLSAKNQENENLKQELSATAEKLAVQEEELRKTTDSLVNIQREKIDLMSEMEEKIKALQLQLSQMSESTHSQITRLTSDLEEARETVAMRDSELTVLQDCLRQLKALEEGQGSERLDALLDVGHARAELALVTMDRDSLKDRLHDEEVARKLLEDHVKVVKEEVNTLRSKFDEAEKDKVEAQTKLDVLSNYFKEKETQLQRELGLQEAMYIQKEGDATNTYERIKSLQEEIEHYKSQNDMLKKEIIDQERSLKGQLVTLEKKAHENWVAARQAERKLEESRQEAGQLRNRLTVIEKNITNTSSNSLDSSKVGDRLQAADSNGEIPTSFLHMGMPEMQDPSYHQHRDRDGHPVSPPLIPGQPLPPFMAIPPPGVFMPPPPLPGAPFVPPPPPPLFPGDRRPPPLGRMSSPPPPPNRYSPEHRGDFSPYDNSPPLSSHGYDDDDDSPPHRYHHRSPLPPLGPYAPPPPPPRQLSRWDDPHSSFRPLPPVHRESPRDSKGSALSSGHSSESLDKSSRHSGRV